MDLKGKVAVITGAAQGIGKAYASALLRKGCKVCISDVNDQCGRETLEELRRDFGTDNVSFVKCESIAKVCISDVNDQCGRETLEELRRDFGTDNVSFVKCDVTKKEQIDELIHAAVDEFKCIDIMINNAGVAREDDPSLCFDINVHGVIRGMTAAIEYMRQDKGGRGGTIINTSSINVFKPVNFLPAYTASKWAVTGYSKSWAEHPDVLNNGIRIVCICPAKTTTDFLNLTEHTTKGLHLYEESKHKYPQMRPDDVGKALIKVLEDKDNHGSCLRVENPPDVQMTYV